MVPVLGYSTLVALLRSVPGLRVQAPLAKGLFAPLLPGSHPTWVYRHVVKTF